MSDNDMKKISRPDRITFYFAIALCLVVGVLLTYGSFRWIKSVAIAYFHISYAAYALLLITIFVISELWALFVQIPGLRAYNELMSPVWNVVRNFVGIILTVVFACLLFFYVVSPADGGFRLFLAKSMYDLSKYATYDYVERLDILDEVMERGNIDPDTLEERGKLYLEVALIKTSENEDYKYTLPNFTASQCYIFAINNLTDAIESLEKEREKNDNNKGDSARKDKVLSECYFLRGKAMFYDSTSKYSDANSDFEKAISIYDDNVEAYFYAARSWYELMKCDVDGAGDQAIKRIQLAIEKTIGVDDSNAEKDATIDKGLLEKNGEASIVPRVEQLAECYYYAGLIYMAGNSDNHYQLAVDQLRNAVLNNSKNAKYYAALGEACYMIGDDESISEAEDSFDQAIVIDKTNSNYSDEGFHLAWKAHVIESNSDRLDEAIKDYESSIRLRPDYAYSYSRLAEIYKNQERNDEAAKIYNQAIKNCSDNASFYYECGLLHYNMGEYNHTITDMNEAIKGNSAYLKDGYYYMGCAYHLLEKYKKALEFYQLALDSGSDRVEEIRRYMQDCEANK